MPPIYLDYMATTPVDPRVAAVLAEHLTLEGNFANPASNTHAYGEQASQAVAKARADVARVINAEPEDIIWTSGATEANNLAIKGAAEFYGRQGKHLITCVTEHPAVLDCFAYLEDRGFTVTYLPVQKSGLIDLADLQAAIRPDTILLSIMHVNNEIGVIQELSKISKLAHEHGVLVHVDAAQSIGKLPLDVQALGIDLLSITAHKIYGPKGIGALYRRHRPRLHLSPQIHGGGHEWGLRSGTLATHQIVGLATAITLAEADREQEQARILDLRNKLWNGIKELPGISLNGDEVKRLAGNVNIAIADIDSHAFLSRIKDAIAISYGAACSSSKIEPSHVLKALQLPAALLHNCFRISIGRFTDEDDIDVAIAAITKQVLA